MKTKWMTRFMALVLCITFLASCLPTLAFAESAENAVSMIEGDVLKDFVPAGTTCESSDTGIVWVDENGSLNALKPGTATVTVPAEDGQTEYTVTVSDYSDGSDVVGNLKILARYNDSMQFYDGHVYLLFTSYQDGVTITVPDLYAGYEISDTYYKDIRDDISNGSNHTGSDAEKYFTFNKEMKSVTLDRGEIVTIGMYRDFDLTVPQAGLGSIKNSSGWTELVTAGKSAAVETLFQFLDNGKASTDEAVAEIKAIIEEIGADYNKLLDGVVDGGVCFNRELYNQKLEWDQYENVSYEMDITRNQLDTMAMYLGGNLNKFSILKNSCATVALRAWNAAVGYRNGEPDAYYLTSAGDGIFSIIDAPKGVRDNIVSRLQGYYLNNSEGVAEPDAGYQDDTGWVYVSAPEKVTPASYVYGDDALVIDESRTKVASLINAAKADQIITYNKDEQQIDIDIHTASENETNIVNAIDFTVNGNTVSLNSESAYGDGIWFKAEIEAPAAGEDYYVTDADGKALPSFYADGHISFFAETLPCKYSIVSGEMAKNVLKTVVINADDTKVETDVYVIRNGEKVSLDSLAEVSRGEKVFIKSTVIAAGYDYVVRDITFNGESVYNSDNFDNAEAAYFVEMPESYSRLEVKYDKAVIEPKGETVIQLSVGDTLNASDCANLLVGDDALNSDHMVWQALTNPDTVEINGSEFKALAEGRAIMRVSPEDNTTIGKLFFLRIYDDMSQMVKVSVSEDTDFNDILLAYSYDDEFDVIPFSGYYVKKGSALEVIPNHQGSKAVLCITANGNQVAPGEQYVVNEDTEVNVKFADAVIKGMPKTINLASKGDTYQLDAKTKYTGIVGIIPVYDPEISYLYSDELISVDETGLITVTGDIPEDGAKVIVTACAGSSNNNVKASTEVILGDYKGSRIVGELTIHARRIDKGELMAHGSVTFTSFEDLDIDASFFDYYEPDDRYKALMEDYEKNPENYNSDPAICNDNELNLTNRESYFTTHTNGAMSAPETISLKAGETMTVSNYGFDSTNMIAVKKALENCEISSVKEVADFIDQMDLYINGNEIDGNVAFDSLIATFTYIYKVSKATGVNPANGHSAGGMDINRELYNQFRRNDSQLPNNYCKVLITADELANLKDYVANPENNHYSFMAKNCATGSVDIWNAVLSDRPELQLTANLTGVAVDPQSLYFQLGEMRLKGGIDGAEMGKDFYPRTVKYSDATKNAIDLIAAIGEVDASDECKSKIDAAREAFNELNDSEKARVWNIAALDKAEEDYTAAKAEADRAAFDMYKLQMAMIADTLAQEDDSEISKALIIGAKAAIIALPYNDKKSLEENMASVDVVVAALAEALSRQRYLEHPILGDVDIDFEVTIRDVTFIQRITALIPIPQSLSDYAADADGDGKVTIIDATFIQKWLVNASSDENIGKPIA